MGTSLEFVRSADNFLNRTPMAQALRSTINKLDLMNLKSFCKSKDKTIAYRLGKSLHQPYIGQRANIQNI